MSSSRRSGHESDDDDYEDECRKFRICIIGRTDVGKSTLMARVFGINEDEVFIPPFHLWNKLATADFTTPRKAQVVNQARALETRSGGAHNIWDGKTDQRRNHALVIHDSRGFEANELESLRVVKDFIAYRSSRPKLADQLHCIW